jgi:hypothetical protein
MSKIETNQYLLNLSENYLLTLDGNITDSLNHHLKIINEFFHNIIENNITNCNNQFLIIIKGIESLLHIYNYLLYYTKNTCLSFYHTQKGIYMYIEFIKQITDEQNNLLNLKINDAVVFIYKKTIYEINKDFMKSKENKKLIKDFSLENQLNILSINSNIIKYIFSFIYNKNNNENLDIKPIINILENIYSSRENYISTMENNFYNLLLFVEILYSNFVNIYTIKQYINCIEQFSKKINKTNITTKYMKEKIYFENNTPIFNLTPTQLIQLFF